MKDGYYYWVLSTLQRFFCLMWYSLAFEKTFTDKKTYRRFLCIKLKIIDSKTQAEIAQHTGFGFRHVQRIQAQVQKYGLAILKPKQGVLTLNSVFKSRLSFPSLAGWFVGGVLFGNPPTRFLIFLDKFRDKPYEKTAV